MAKFRILKSHKLTYRIASQNLLRYGEKLGEAMVEYSVDYFWVVICKNRRFHHKGNTSYEHRIALGETDPFSPQPMLTEDLNVRCAIFRYVTDFNRKPEYLLFATKNETTLGRRVMLRTVKSLCKRLGFDPPARTLHSFRHTFAVNYLRRGGSVFHLQKVLGHSTLEMTRRYANLTTEDLQAVHQSISLFSS